MKRLVSILVTFFVFGTVFATSFKVVGVEGKVFYETSQNEV